MIIAPNKAISTFGMAYFLANKISQEHFVFSIRSTFRKIVIFTSQSSTPSDMDLRVNEIPTFEANFQSPANIHYSFDPFSIPVGDNDNLMLDGFLCRRLNPPRPYFEAEKFEKKYIFLHFTAGNLQGDLPTLTGNSGRISTAFVLARSGNLFQLFSSAHWAWHLGRSAVGPFRNGNNTFLSKHSIGIEISNYGPLMRIGEILHIPVWDKNRRKFIPGAPYCTLSDQASYIQLATPYRGNTYYCSYTDEQYDRLIILLRYLTNSYPIPKSFLPANIRYETNGPLLENPGIYSHVNVRKDKVDIGPAFDWDRVIEGVLAPTFFPQHIQLGPPFAARGLEGPISSEAQMEELQQPTRSRSIEPLEEPTEEEIAPLINLDEASA